MSHTYACLPRPRGTKHFHPSGIPGVEKHAFDGSLPQDHNDESLMIRALFVQELCSLVVTSISVASKKAVEDLRSCRESGLLSRAEQPELHRGSSAHRPSKRLQPSDTAAMAVSCVIVAGWGNRRDQPLTNLFANGQLAVNCTGV